MKPLALLLAVLLSSPATTEPLDGGYDVPGEPKVVDVELAVLTIVGTDGGTVTVHGGGWLSTDTLMAAAKREVAFDTANKELEKNAVTPDASTVLIISSFITAAFLTGMAVDRFLLPKPSAPK